MTEAEKLYTEAGRGVETRKNLIALRQLLEDEAARRKFMYFLGGDFELLYEFLKNEDPKVRKSAARILSMTEDEDVLPQIITAWEKEETLYLREDYLKAMEALDYRSYLPLLEKTLKELTEGKGLPGNRAGEDGASPHTSSDKWDNDRHLDAEILRLRQMIRRYKKPGKHHFVKMNPAPDLILMTNRCQAAVTAGQIRSGETKILAGGVHVRHGDLDEILRVRTFRECLFTVPSARSLPGDEKEIARGLNALRISSYLDTLHEKSSDAYRYRIELKSAGIAREKRGDFIRRIAAALDRLENGKLENSDSDYEVEIRLIERKDHSYAVLLKLFTLPDRRFDYRLETDAQSMAPVNAALCVSLAEPWLKEGAQVLDPFCGTGSLLIERKIACGADPVYGVDMQGEAIRKARINTEEYGRLLREGKLPLPENKPAQTEASSGPAAASSSSAADAASSSSAADAASASSSSAAASAYAAVSSTSSAADSPAAAGRQEEPAKKYNAGSSTVIHYINRNFFDFSHDYLFDEIITELPRLREDQVDLFAQNFLKKSRGLLKNGAVLVIISDAPKSLIRAIGYDPSYHLEAEFDLNERIGSKEMILTYQP